MVFGRLDASGSHDQKYAASDPFSSISSRAHFAGYMTAYEDMIRHTSTETAPWYVVPADRKWFTRIVVSAAIIDAIESIDPKFPEVDPKVRAEFKRVKEQLENEERPKTPKKAKVSKK